MERQPEPEYMDLADEADAYAQADFADVNAAFAERLAELTENRPAWALDLGCGPVDIPIRVAALRPAWHIAAVDASWAMLALAPNPPVLVHRIQADAKRLPVPDRVFDVVFSNSILHHLPNPEPFWQEVRRISRPGTLILVRDLFRPESRAAARALVDHHAGTESPLLQEEFYRSLLAAFTPEEAREQLAMANLKGLEVTTITDRHLDIWGRLG